MAARSPPTRTDEVLGKGRAGRRDPDRGDDPLAFLKDVGLTDTLLALIVPAVPTDFGTFLMRQCFMTMPKELSEDSMIDGAGSCRILRSAYAPPATPGLAIVGVRAFNHRWNDFFRLLVLETSSQNFLMPLGLAPCRATSDRGNLPSTRGSCTVDDPGGGSGGVRDRAAAASGGITLSGLKA